MTGRDMKIIKKLTSMTEYSRRAHASGRKLGFVPTMGYLHEGHLSLIRYARAHSDELVVSIFVNPIQFGPKEDLKKYPRDVKRDIGLISPLGVNVLLLPKEKEVFPEGFGTTVEIEGISDELCGRSRPGHFRGVATVVAKLFNIVSPDVAFFGNKDFQQLVIIRKMVKDLNLAVKIVGRPTVRERDGLAMSSRNTYLSNQERASAATLYASLKLAKRMAGDGVRSPARLVAAMKKLIGRARPKVVVDYIEVCDPATLKRRRLVSRGTLIAIAAYVGGTRLIDNILI